MAKKLTGEIISTKMEKTVIVLVEKKFSHKKYRKIITRHKKYKVHCENKDIKLGDKVEIMATRPLSKEKHFIVIKKI